MTSETNDRTSKSKLNMPLYQSRTRGRDNEILAWLMSGLFGVLSGFFLVIGYQLEKIDRIDLTDKNAMMVMVAIMAVLTVDTMHVWKNYNQSFEGKKLFGLMKLNKADYQNATDEKIFGTKVLYKFQKYRKF